MHVHISKVYGHLKTRKGEDTYVVFSRFFYIETMAIEIKLATTTEEQIKRLRDRGMTIDNEPFATETLLDIGYYR